MSDEFHYTFKCPKCGCPTFEEILINVTQSTTFQRVNCDAEITEPDYQNTSTEGGEINRYQCQSCGFILQNEQRRHHKRHAGSEAVAGEKRPEDRG